MLENDVTPLSVDAISFYKKMENLQKEDDISVTVSAPGKVILYGEHSVVYGKLAVAASLGLRTKLSLNETELKTDQPNYVKIDLPDINLVHMYDLKDLQHSLLAPVLPLTKSPSSYNWTKPDLLSHNELLHIIGDYVNRSAGTFPLTLQQNLSLCSLFYLLTGIFASADITLKPFTLQVKTDLSISSGSGSSASYSVCIAAAFVHYLRLLITKRQYGEVSKHGYKSMRTFLGDLKHFTEKELEIISKWAYLSEKIMHGSPSGIDNTICTYGSLVEFRKSSGSKVVKLNKKIKLLLINTKIKRDTKQIVASVALLKERYASIIEPILEAMDEVAQNAVNTLLCLNNSTDPNEIDSCFHKLGELTDFNQHLLQALGTSHPTLDKICSIVKLFNLNCKLTGAGGGGYAIVLIPSCTSDSTVDRLIVNLSAEGFDAILTDLGGLGVTIDNCSMSFDSL